MLRISITRSASGMTTKRSVCALTPDACAAPASLRHRFDSRAHYLGDTVKSTMNGVTSSRMSRIPNVKSKLRNTGRSNANGLPAMNTVSAGQ
ncbi:MAG: hypothetical protein BGP08_15615 [Rhizobiales bacterium 64-17]|nr:MAG: hypothetical protein BGP08_15615 [Rhizobiales bacterium 64-17]